MKTNEKEFLQMENARTGAAAAVLKGILYVTGGLSKNKLVERAERFK